MRAFERLIQYARIHTQSADGQGVTPSTPCQWELAHRLVDELKELGLENPSVNEFCVVTAWLPATPGCEQAPALGLLAHLDTAPAFSGEHVQPILHPDYDGGDVVLPKEGRVIRADKYPFLQEMKGKTLITADGSTLLGADDKAGIAEIMTLCQRLQQEALPHGRLCIAFTPDEEIGEGPNHFDVASFGARYAYTVDGGRAGSIEYENFNGATVRVNISGVSVHPGYAKGIMENALLIACHFNSLLPAGETPATTEGYEGFFHLCEISGDPAAARMEYIIRDHDRAAFEGRKAAIQEVARQVRLAHPNAGIEVSVTDSYYNMREQLTDCMHLVEHARTAAQMAGLSPVVEPIRGGTDGARLSYMGLPCPNLGTGGHNFHGPYECVAAEDMDAVVEMLCHLVELYSRM